MIITCAARLEWKSMPGVWWPVVAGLLALYVPTFLDLATGLWTTEGYAHGPIILALALWLIVRQWSGMLQACKGKSGSAAGWPICVFGLMLYIIGRSMGAPVFELASFVVLLTSIVLIMCGGSALKMQWFPVFFMLFMIPLPGEILIVLTLPMKMAVSYVVEQILFWAGYPIARSGVILQIAQYQLLVADACAGLQTLLTLEALGLFYLNVVRHTSALRNAVLAILIVPISFAANVIRVIVLTLITYHLGDEAGRSFLHGFAGLALFITALLLIVGLDTLLRLLVKIRALKAISTSRSAA